MSEKTPEKGTIQPPDLTGKAKKEPEKSEKKEELSKKQIVAMVIAGIGFVLVVGLIFAFGLNSGDDEPEPIINQPTQSESINGPPVNPDPSNPSAPAMPSAAPTGGQVAPTADAPQNEVQRAAENFMENIKSGKTGQEWADSMKPMVTSAFYESLKGASPDSIPDGAESVSVSGSAGAWTGTVNDSEGSTLYTFRLGGFKQFEQEGDAVLLVESMEVPQPKRTLDEDGFPIKPPIAPMNESSMYNLKVQAYHVAKQFFEHTKDESVEQRTEEMKRVVHDGELSPLRPVYEGYDNNVQMYGPEQVRPLIGALGDPVKEGYVSIHMLVHYADSTHAKPEPWEEVFVAVDFRWNEEAQIWEPGGFRTLSVRPLKAFAVQ